jgi:hypothetical protein
MKTDICKGQYERWENLVSNALQNNVWRGQEFNNPVMNIRLPVL